MVFSRVLLVLKIVFMIRDLDINYCYLYTFILFIAEFVDSNKLLCSCILNSKYIFLIYGVSKLLSLIDEKSLGFA